MIRKISGLRWAKLAERPAGLPRGRPRGAKGRGLAYQRQLEAALPEAAAGQWYEFEDRNGRGFCQTDLVLRWGEDLVVLEAKYSWVEEGHLQLERLYLPVLRHIVGGRRRVLGVVVVKRLRLRMPEGLTLAGDLEEAIAGTAEGRSVWHWIGGPVRRAAEAAAA